MYIIFVPIRYATSKCKQLEDASTAQLYGLCGESLASLARISKSLKIVSRCTGSNTVFQKSFLNGISQGVILCTERRPCQGTTVTVEELFFCQPVRKKRLNPTLELEKTQKVLECIALMHSNVSFSLRNDVTGEVFLQTRKASSVFGTFAEIHGKEAGSSLREICYKLHPFELTGYFGCKAQTRKDLQYIYINKRFVENTKAHRLINDLWKKNICGSQLNGSSCCRTNKKEAGFPTFVLNIVCPLEEVDVIMLCKKQSLELKNWEPVLKCIRKALKQCFQVEGVGHSNKQNSQEVIDEVLGLEFLEEANENKEISTKEQNCLDDNKVKYISPLISLQSKVVHKRKVQKLLNVHSSRTTFSPAVKKLRTSTPNQPKKQSHCCLRNANQCSRTKKAKKSGKHKSGVLREVKPNLPSQDFFCVSSPQEVLHQHVNDDKYRQRYVASKPSNLNQFKPFNETEIQTVSMKDTSHNSSWICERPKHKSLKTPLTRKEKILDSKHASHSYRLQNSHYNLWRTRLDTYFESPISRGKKLQHVRYDNDRKQDRLSRVDVNSLHSRKQNMTSSVFKKVRNMCLTSKTEKTSTSRTDKTTDVKHDTTKQILKKIECNARFKDNCTFAENGIRTVCKAPTEEQSTQENGLVEIPDFKVNVVTQTPILTSQFENLNQKHISGQLADSTPTDTNGTSFVGTIFNLCPENNQLFLESELHHPSASQVNVARREIKPGCDNFKQISHVTLPDNVAGDKQQKILHDKSCQTDWKWCKINNGVSIESVSNENRCMELSAADPLCYESDSLLANCGSLPSCYSDQTYENLQALSATDDGGIVQNLVEDTEKLPVNDKRSNWSEVEYSSAVTNFDRELHSSLAVNFFSKEPCKHSFLKHFNSGNLYDNCDLDVNPAWDWVEGVGLRKLSNKKETHVECDNVNQSPYFEAASHFKEREEINKELDSETFLVNVSSRFPLQDENEHFGSTSVLSCTKDFLNSVNSYPLQTSNTNRWACVETMKNGKNISDADELAIPLFAALQTQRFVPQVREPPIIDVENIRKKARNLKIVEENSNLVNINQFPSFALKSISETVTTFPSESILKVPEPSSIFPESSPKMQEPPSSPSESMLTIQEPSKPSNASENMLTIQEPSSGPSESLLKIQELFSSSSEMYRIKEPSSEPSESISGNEEPFSGILRKSPRFQKFPGGVSVIGVATDEETKLRRPENMCTTKEPCNSGLKSFPQTAVLTNDLEMMDDSSLHLAADVKCTPSISGVFSETKISVTYLQRPV